MSDLQVNHDPEKGRRAHLRNDEVAVYSWSRCNVTVKDRLSKQSKTILHDVSGTARAGISNDVFDPTITDAVVGELVALMGPSGSGKTTLLNVLAQRHAAAGAQTRAELYLNGRQSSKEELRKLSAYVEQEDALIGSLTAKETIDIAARLSRTRYGLLYIASSSGADQGAAYLLAKSDVSLSMSSCLPSVSEIKRAQSLARRYAKVSVVGRRDGLVSLAN